MTPSSRASASIAGLLTLLSLASACGPGGGMATSGPGGGSGAGEVGDASVGGSAGAGGSGTDADDLEAILAELRADPTAALTKHAGTTGWPVPIGGGRLFVATDPTLSFVAGDHDGWQGTPMKADAGFVWAVVVVPPGERYKLTDKSTFKADPWARSYTFDANGEISLVTPTTAHLDRWPAVRDANVAPRTVRVWVPAAPITHELYLHDGQNLFDPAASYGGWHLEDVAPSGMLLVGIDNTPDRVDEYTHVADVIDGQATGGKGDAYADFVEGTVRPLIRERYGEPGPVGVLGSSLGGLISFHIADRAPGQYAFAGSLSGTMGWGSIGAGIHNETMIERYQKHGHRKTVLYVDSGGDGPCVDSDADGVDDDGEAASDNYCENAELRDALYGAGYAKDQDFFYAHAPGAPHNEAAWAARVSVPLQIFDQQ